MATIATYAPETEREVSSRSIEEACIEFQRSWSADERSRRRRISQARQQWLASLLFAEQTSDVARAA